jgi:methylmalonyl-CoA mutase
MYVMTPEFGAATQLEKIDMLDFADVVAINKFDKRGALDAIRDVRKQYKRNHQIFEAKDEELPVYGTIASQFNDPGTNRLYKQLMDIIVERTQADLKTTFEISDEMSEKIFIIPPKRVRYLAEIAENNRSYDQWSEEQAEVAQQLYSIQKSMDTIKEMEVEDKDRLLKNLQESFEKVKLNLDPKNLKLIEEWPEKQKKYTDEIYTFKVRDKEIKMETHTKSLSHSPIPKVALPKYNAWGDLLQWNLQENVPG